VGVEVQTLIGHLEELQVVVVRQMGALSSFGAVRSHCRI
jgi:hypothetical protein